MTPFKLTKLDIRRLFELLNGELAAEDIEGEIYLVGGAVMCLALDARGARRDVDAFFRPTRLIREAAARVAARAGLPDAWLNDAIKGYLSPHGEYDPYLELESLRVFVAQSSNRAGPIGAHPVEPLRWGIGIRVSAAAPNGHLDQDRQEVQAIVREEVPCEARAGA